MSRWFRHYAGDVPSLSVQATLIAMAAFDQCVKRKTCYPQWGDVMRAAPFHRDHFYDLTTELEDKGIVNKGFPSTLLALEPIFPLRRDGDGRPTGRVWAEIRTRIFIRDNFTCTYCGQRGKKLECDHVMPLSRGGSNDDENLVTACFRCNRSKGGKLLAEWRAS